MLRRINFIAIFTLTAALVVTPLAEAQLTTFAQFNQSVGGNPFTYTHVGTAGSGGQATLSLSSPLAIDFRYLSIVGLPVDLNGLQAAHMTFTSFTSLGATVAGTGVSEIFNGGSIITITRDTPAAEGNGSRTILLQAIFTPYTFTGSGGSGGFSASSLSGTVTFSSDFLDFSSAIQRDVGVSFSSIIPGLSIDPSGFLSDFTAAATGTFSSNPTPVFIPEPSTYGMVGAVGVFGLIVLARRRRLLQRA